MAWIAVTFWGLFLAILLAQSLTIRQYLRWLVIPAKPTEPNSRWPHTAVILSLRGGDVSLDECLTRLSQLEYPNYEIHIIIDHESDPSRPIVEAWRRTVEDVAVRVHILREISSQAYLKTSAIRQCLKQLLEEDSAIEMAVIVDADTQVYPRWMHDMIQPMLGTRIGLVTGNRWYDPTTPGWGTLVRYIYNANAVAPMYFMHATWAGSLAIRREVFARRYFFDRMWNTSSEECAMQDATREAGYQLATQANAMMPNREAIDIMSCFRFIRRQLLWTRLYHRKWPHILIGTACNYALLLAATVLSIVAAARSEWLSMLALGGVIVLVTVANLAFTEWLHRVITARMVHLQSTCLPALDLRTRLRLLAALPLALVIHTYATFAAAGARYVTWRGIRYEVQAPHSLKLVRYEPLLAQTIAAARGTAGRSVPMPNQLEWATEFGRPIESGSESLS